LQRETRDDLVIILAFLQAVSGIHIVCIRFKSCLFHSNITLTLLYVRAPHRGAYAYVYGCISSAI